MRFHHRKMWFLVVMWCESSLNTWSILYMSQMTSCIWEYNKWSRRKKKKIEAECMTLWEIHMYIYIYVSIMLIYVYNVSDTWWVGWIRDKSSMPDYFLTVLSCMCVIRMVYTIKENFIWMLHGSCIVIPSLTWSVDSRAIDRTSVQAKNSLLTLPLSVIYNFFNFSIYFYLFRIFIC